ncbi:MAG: lysylphosphatidylglycerol synthase transmembrane domain-containing protein [Bacteroidota bacterium]
MREKQRKHLTTAVKFLVSLLLLYFIFTKIEFQDVLRVLRTANPLWLLMALLLFVVSKILNAFRLNLLFHTIGVPLTQISNLKLYLLGMFYNLFLPGGIGGDAYKGYVIQKKFQSGTKRVVAVLLLDRLNGMLFILIYALLFMSFLPHPWLQAWQGIALAAIPLGLLVFWWITKKGFLYILPVFWKVCGYSAMLQGIQVLAVLCIIQSLNITADGMAYLFIFMISSVVSVIPLTIGGIGSREITFLYGAKWLGLAADTAIGISFVFFMISALVSLFGIGYHLKKPALETC